MEANSTRDRLSPWYSPRRRKCLSRCTRLNVPSLRRPRPRGGVVHFPGSKRTPGRPLSYVVELRRVNATRTPTSTEGHPPMDRQPQSLARALNTYLGSVRRERMTAMKREASA